MTTQTQQNSTQYFNLHTHGVGYLNDIREVKPKKGNPFWACRIAALVGDTNEPEYRFFDLLTSTTGSFQKYPTRIPLL